MAFFGRCCCCYVFARNELSFDSTPFYSLTNAKPMFYVNITDLPSKTLRTASDWMNEWMKDERQHIGFCFRTKRKQKSKQRETATESLKKCGNKHSHVEYFVWLDRCDVKTWRWIVCLARVLNVNDWMKEEWQ